MAIRINEKAQQMMQAQLAVSSAVETLMAEGIKSSELESGGSEYNFGDDELLRVTVQQESGEPYYTVVVRYYETPEDAEQEVAEPLVEVTTVIREVVAGS
jgi:hypothetical protein